MEIVMKEICHMIYKKEKEYINVLMVTDMKGILSMV
jgi:hypothetical protein